MVARRTVTARERRRRPGGAFPFVRRRIAAFAALTAALGCGQQSPPPESAGAADPASGSRPSTDAPFVEVARDVGLVFVHQNGMTGEYWFAEMMGAGAALFDYDGDGDLDAYLVQGGALGGGNELTDRLFRNELVTSPRRGANARTGALRFVDVTETSGLETTTGYGMGVAAGDVDNDGDVDLYLTSFGPNRLLRNDGANGRVTFTDVTAEAGVDDPRWSVAAAFFDYDRDGRLDLYVGNYVDFTLGNHRRCFDAAGARDYCAPSAYRGEADRLFRNVGEGGRIAFEDVSRTSGVGTLPAPSLGALAADFDGDGWQDLYVANDGAPNFLWLNRRDGTFEETALLAGCAVDEDGRPQASMGVDLGDVDADGDDDLFMSHLTGETNALFAGDGAGGAPEGGRLGYFRDATAGSGLGAASLAATGFGTGFLDAENDGWLDLLVVNGAVKTIEELAAAGDPFPLHQRNQLFLNTGAGRFEEVSARAGAAFELSEVSRGAAFGDIDSDGDVDVLVTNNNGPARLLLNQAGGAGGWIGLRLMTSRRDALGARVQVLRPGEPALVRRARTDGSYASASDPRVVVGLGDQVDPVDVAVTWPDGSRETWKGLGVRRYHSLRQGSSPAP